MMVALLNQMRPPNNLKPSQHRKIKQMHILVLTRQIGHYHDARYRGAHAVFERVSVVQTASEGGFAEFLATRVGDYERHSLYDNRKAYDEALQSGNLPKDLSKLLDKLSPDVIAVAGWANSESAAGIRWAKSNGIPVVMMSESQADDASRSWAREKVKSHVVRMSDAAFVGGPPHARYIQRLGMPKSQIAFGYNAVDNKHFSQGAKRARKDAARLRGEHGLPDSYFLASARFIAKKNLPALVTAHALVSQKNPNTPELVILGDGEERIKIEQARSAHPKPETVHLPGFKGYDDLPVFYGLAAAFVHVSTVEQWGLVVNEAMSAGTPVIVSDKCGVARTVLRNGINGWITGTDQGEIASALCKFNGMSEDEQVAMGQIASADFSDWGPARFGNGLRQAAEIALAAHKPQVSLGLFDKLVLAWIEKSSIDQVS